MQRKQIKMGSLANAAILASIGSLSAGAIYASYIGYLHDMDCGLEGPGCFKGQSMPPNSIGPQSPGHVGYVGETPQQLEEDRRGYKAIEKWQARVSQRDLSQLQKSRP